MSAETVLCEAAALADGQALRVMVYDQAIAVFRINGRYHATDDTCTHGFASLAEGDIEGGLVICPWHGGAFDIATGAAVRAPCAVALKTYACVVDEGRVQAQLDVLGENVLWGDEGV